MWHAVLRIDYTEKKHLEKKRKKSQEREREREIVVVLTTKNVLCCVILKKD